MPTATRYKTKARLVFSAVVQVALPLLPSEILVRARRVSREWMAVCDEKLARLLVELHAARVDTGRLERRLSAESALVAMGVYVKNYRAGDDGYVAMHFVAGSAGAHGVPLLLMQEGADVCAPAVEGLPALHIAAETAGVEVVKALGALGADVHAEALVCGYPVTVAYIAAVWRESGKIEMLRALVELGADINQVQAEGFTPLISAVMQGSVEGVQALVEVGADPNIMGIDGTSALYVAVDMDDVDMVRVLVAAGADLNPVDITGTTPLFAAALKGNREILQVLVGAGADLNIADQQGNTPLAVAVHQGNLEVLRALIQAGADLNHPNIYGGTPLDESLLRDEAEVLAMLWDAGAVFGGWVSHF